MNSRDLRNVVMIGGPNGAGKTTWAVRNLASTVDIDEFVNADEIARGLSPLKPERVALAAGKAMLTRLNALVDAGDSFAFETTCAGRTHVRLREDIGLGSAICGMSILPLADTAIIFDNSDGSFVTIANNGSDAR
jgi:predicted ABC-type ATPase